MAKETLFEEMEIGSLRAKNRLVRAATYEALADDGGHMTPELTAIYEELADGGVGTIIVGYARVMRNEQPNPRMLGIYDDSFVPEFRALTDMAHAHGTAIVSQIVYGGSAGASSGRRPSPTRRPASCRWRPRLPICMSSPKHSPMRRPVLKLPDSMASSCMRRTATCSASS